jgi:hypothetical protein
VFEVHDLQVAVPPELALLPQAVVTAIVTTIAEAARSEWIRLAGESLHTTRGDYINGIQPVEVLNEVATVTLVGVLPNLLEQGMEATDLHDTLLGPNVPVVPQGARGKHEKTDGSGHYRSIPFRHRTGNRGAGFGNPYQGHAAVADAAKLGRSIYRQAKQLSGTTSNPYSGTKGGGRLPAGLAPKLRPHHAVDIFAGMTRQQKTYEQATQSQYTTFRTIATGSPGWMRPATPGAHLAQKVSEYVGQIAPQAFSAYIAALK